MMNWITRRQPFGHGVLLPCVVACLLPALAAGQDPSVRFGETVPRDVREIYDRGLDFLANSQLENGQWSAQGGQNNRSAGATAGATALALMVMLASGEDPNFGLYSNHVRRGLRSLISGQGSDTGIIGTTMYEHGFAMLTLAEAYGAVDDRNLWDGVSGKTRTVGQALELAVRGAITSQKKNPVGGWRYQPDATDSDTSVAGAVLVGLLAARNAGIEVPDAAIDRAITYYTKMTSPSGEVAYTGGVGGFAQSTARTSIATLVFSVARRKDLPEFKATLGHLVQQLDVDTSGPFVEYSRYYQAQALFQGDVEAWRKWNKMLVRQLKATQVADGSFPSQLGTTVGTSLSLLALAVNYRFLPIYER